jgi:phosphoribosylanthranilate isomerase
MLIKASRITNLTDARYFAAKEVDFLGFNLEESTEGYLDPMYMKAIREWVEGPKIVGEFSRSPLAYVREAAAFFGLDAVQVTADYLAQLADLEGLEVILEAPTDMPHSSFIAHRFFEEAAPFVSYFLVKMDIAPPLSEILKLAESSLLKKICANYPILLQIEAGAERLPEILEVLKPAGLSLVGGEEEQVGVKSFDEIEAIFGFLGR